MKISKVVAALVVLAILVASLLLWRSSGNDTQPLKPQSLTIATFSKALGNTPYHVAKHFKWFEEDPSLKGVSIAYKEFNDRPTISSAFSGGELQVLFSADVPSIICRAQGNDIRVVALATVVTQNILARSELRFDSLTDLKGKRLAVLQGTSSHYCLLKVLKQHKLQESDFELVYMPAPEAKVAFETDKIDAWAVWAPFVEQQQVRGKGRIVEDGNAVINSVMTVSATFLNKHEQAAKAVATAIERAKKWIVDHPDEAQAIAAQELGLDLAVVKTAWPKHDWKTSLDKSIIPDLQEKADFLSNADKTRAMIDVKKDFVDLRFAPKTP